MSDPITVIIFRLVRAGQEQAFEDAVKAWIPQALAFPGHLGVHMLRPYPGSREYAAVLKFSTQQEWDAFRQAPAYQEFLAQIRPMLEEEPRVQTECGLESWFTPLGSQVLRVPPRWKMAVVTWLGVCLMVYTVQQILSPLSQSWPPLLTYLIVNAGVVAGLTWIVMPVLIRLFRFWLHPASKSK
jgi:uncharacterized protein